MVDAVLKQQSQRAGRLGILRYIAERRRAKIVRVLAWPVRPKVSVGIIGFSLPLSGSDYTPQSRIQKPVSLRQQGTLHFLFYIFRATREKCSNYEDKVPLTSDVVNRSG